MKEYSTIVKPITTEKSSRQQESGQYSFMVRKDATKIDVKHAIKAIYGVDVEDVRSMLVPKKERLVGRGRIWTKRPVFKKVVITLKGKGSLDPNKPTFKETKKK